jgi:hypothetical protein
MSVNEVQVLNTAIGRRLRSARLKSGQPPSAVNWACGWSTIKSFLPPIKLPTEVYALEDFPRAWERQKKSPLVLSQCAVARVSLYGQDHHRPQALRKGTHHETARQ